MNKVIFLWGRRIQFARSGCRQAQISRFNAAAGLALLLVLASSCRTIENTFYGRDYELKPADVLTLKFQDGHEECAVITANGRVPVQGLEKVDTRQRTASELQAEIREKLPGFRTLSVDVRSAETEPLHWHYTQPYSVSLLDRINVHYDDGRSESFQVNQSGTLKIGSAGDLVVKELNPKQVLELLRGKIKQVASIDIEEFRPNRVSVIGEVYHQIHTELTEGPMRVLDAIAAANGFTALAKSDRVKLIRENAGEVDVYELNLRAAMHGYSLNHNLFLRAGDVITVPKNFL
jgi:protein involved in polysaccharide export with SLBB domain